MQKYPAILLIVIVLTVVSAVPRFYGLGSLGFYGDEETTSLPSRSLAEGEGPKMPSGMEYRRALPQTWLNALSASYFGLDREFSYRLPAAIFGILTIPLFFLLSYRFVGVPTALLAALILAFSEWHILLSRTARMYAPFLFFYMSSGFMLLRWATTNLNRYLYAAIPLFCFAFLFHALGIFAIVFALIPVAFMGWSRVSPARLGLFAFVAAAVAYLYKKYYVNAAYKVMNLISETASAELKDSDISLSSLLYESIVKIPVFPAFLVVVGAFCGWWVVRKSRVEDGMPGFQLRIGGRYVLGILAGSLACSGHFYGAVMCALLFLTLHPLDGYSWFKKVWQPVGIILFLSIIQLVMIVTHLGFVDGLKSTLKFPFPYLLTLAQMYPGVLLLFFGMSIYLAWCPDDEKNNPLKACFLATVLPIVAIGVVKDWGGARYLVEAYPFLLLVAAAGLYKLLSVLCPDKLPCKETIVLFVAVALIMSGLLGGHGLPQTVKMATLQYGEEYQPYSIYPDHKGPGEFVRENLVAGDVVVAEDVIQQAWYVGHVDYWLRNFENHSKFFYHAEDGNFRDIYTNSLSLTPESLRLLPESGKRVWILTSGETYNGHDYYLSSEQNRWLSKVESDSSPVFVGRDGVTKVYLLNTHD